MLILLKGYVYLPEPCFEGPLDCPLSWSGTTGLVNFPGSGGKFLNPSISGMSPKQDKKDSFSPQAIQPWYRAF